MDILQNNSFQFLLEHYPRVRNDFVVAPHQEDKDSSLYCPIVVHGKEYKPEDYLKLFQEFLRNELDSIDALEILLKRPKDLNTGLLDELTRKLTERPEEFTEQHLRRAYGNNLADIIGMIRSALSDEPLLTTKERVQKAMTTISIGRAFSDREKQWLDLIANHLEYNLLIERRHFAYIPFSGKGGWKKLIRTLIIS